MNQVAGSVLGGLASLTAGGPPPPAPRCPEGLPGQQPASGNSLYLNPASPPGGASGILPTEAALGDRRAQACSWCWRLADSLLLRLQQRAACPQLWGPDAPPSCSCGPSQSPVLVICLQNYSSPPHPHTISLFCSLNNKEDWCAHRFLWKSALLIHPLPGSLSSL